MGLRWGGSPEEEEEPEIENYRLCTRKWMAGLAGRVPALREGFLESDGVAVVLVELVEERVVGFGGFFVICSRS